MLSNILDSRSNNSSRSNLPDFQLPFELLAASGALNQPSAQNADSNLSRRTSKVIDDDKSETFFDAEEQLVNSIGSLPTPSNNPVEDGYYSDLVFSVGEATAIQQR